MTETLELIALRISKNSSSKSIWNSILWIRPLGTNIDCITVLLLKLLNTSTLCIWYKSTLVILCFYGDFMKIIILIKNVLQLLPVALPLKLGALHIYFIWPPVCGGRTTPKSNPLFLKIFILAFGGPPCRGCSPIIFLKILFIYFLNIN
jgi:hypothetical protein